MEKADKTKNEPAYVGHEIEKKRWVPQNRQTPAGTRTEFGKPDLLAVELAAQLLKAETRLEAETAKRKQAEKKLRTSQNRVRMLTAELMVTEERERHRLAQDLHDTVAQCLAGCRYKLETFLENRISRSGSAQIGECIDFIDQAIKQTRLLMFECYPWILHESGLEATFRNLAQRIQEAYGIQVACIGDGAPDTLDRDLRILLFRTIRELLFNVIKHARAKHATISINRAKNQICITVEDDGIGFNIAETLAEQENKNGFGLFSIRERLGRLGGRLDLISLPGEGTRASVVVPG
ncbi:MAG: sensor histidine kinase [Desulfobacterales bacterium]